MTFYIGRPTSESTSVLYLRTVNKIASINIKDPQILTQLQHTGSILLITDNPETRAQLEDWKAQQTGMPLAFNEMGSSDYASLEALPLHVNVLVIDDDLKHLDNIRLLEKVRSKHPEISILMLARKSQRQEAVEAMKSGATDYIFKRDLTLETLKKSLHFCLERYHQLELIERRNVIIEALFNDAHEAIFLMDEKGKLTLTNEVFDAMFPYDHKEPDSFSSFLKAQLGVNEFVFPVDGKNLEERHFSLIKNGRTRHFKMKLKKIDLRNRFERLIGHIVDITESQRANKAQLRADQLELTARMARILAHEIRNPLTNIRLSTDYLNECMDAGDSSKTYTEIIQRNTERIDDLITNLLQSSKPFEIKKSMSNLELMVQAALAKVEDRKSLLDANVIYDNRLKETLWNLDSEKMELVLINLMTNAFEAMSSSEKPRLKLVLSKENNWLKIEITDNGKGMSEIEREKVFEAFFTGRKGGMGLGMTTVHNIVSAHMGEIELNSKENQGTTFIIKLPAK